MSKYRMFDTWECEEPYTATEKELFNLAYELYCGNPVSKELHRAKEEFKNNIPKVIAYIEKESGWRAEAV